MVAMRFNLHKEIQKRLAMVSIGPSTARNMGPQGTIQATREFLARMRLDKFSKASEEEFRKELNRATTLLLKHLPGEASEHWGAARKFLNIFMCGAFYNRFLCERYGFDVVEPWLELPLDSHVARGLRSEPGGESLPKWNTVIGLTPEGNGAYQKFAAGIAERKGTYRVHLDLIYWRAEKQKP